MEDENQTKDADAEGEESAVRADEPKICANCGAEIEATEWHPLVTQTDDEGNFRVYAFCDEGCRKAWAEN